MLKALIFLPLLKFLFVPRPHRFLLKNKVLANQSFQKFLFYRFTLVVALFMQMTIMSYYLYDITNDVWALGKIGLWEAIPAIGFSFISGTIVDRSEKRNLLIKCALAYLGLTLFYLLISTSVGGYDLSIKGKEMGIYFGSFVGGIIRAFLGPSNFSMMGLIVPRKRYANATTWSSTAWQSGEVIGPILGGSLMALCGLSNTLYIILGLLIIIAVTIARIPKQPILFTEKEPTLKSLRLGFQYLFNNKLILSVLALDMFAVLFGGATALLPAFAKDIYKVGEFGFGWLRAAQGLGAIFTLFILTVVPIQNRAGFKMLTAVGMFGVCNIIFGWSTSVYVAFAMLWMSGVFDAVSVVIRGTILQLHTPDHMRGRISAINTMFVTSSNELGAAESGLVAKWIGTTQSVIVGGFMTIGVVLFTAKKNPKLMAWEFNDNQKKVGS
jgi:MFS family permease